MENRPRSMIKSEDINKREPFALHASREISKDATRAIIECAPDLMADHEMPWIKLASITSAVIATAIVWDVWHVANWTPSRIAASCAGYGISDQARFVFGPVVYLLKDIRVLSSPVKCPGKLGFWKLPEDIEAQVRWQMNGGTP